MFGLIEDSDQIKGSLREMSNSTTMLAPGGLRSLSAMDQFYREGSDYWRGNIWISVNFLALRGLFDNYMDVNNFNVQGAQINTGRDLYNIIRYRVIKSVYQNWLIEHRFWENFNDMTGEGQFAYPFTGWTTLILLIVS